MRSTVCGDSGTGAPPPAGFRGASDRDTAPRVTFPVFELLGSDRDALIESAGEL